MNLSALDLNLLVALDALLLEANVSRAAMRIGLSQPAASHALQRLREVLGDPLLVRVGARMELTPRAQGLRGPLAQVLDQVRGLLIPDDFNAARSERRFRLMMPDLAVELLVPPLMEKVTRLAPNVQLDVVPWRGPAIFSAEFARTIDFVISIDGPAETSDTKMRTPPPFGVYLIALSTRLISDCRSTRRSPSPRGRPATSTVSDWRFSSASLPTARMKNVPESS